MVEDALGRGFQCEWGDPESVLMKENKAAVVPDCRSMYDILTQTALPSCSEHRTAIERLLISERGSDPTVMLGGCLAKLC